MNRAAVEPAKPAAKRRPAKTKSTSPKSATKKGTTAKTTRPAAAKKASLRSPQLKEPSDADIRLRAYFIAERRVQLALHGDPALDWIEARQQLVQEARGAKS